MATISYLTRIEFGEGEIARLGEHLATLGVTKPLIVTDKGLVGAGLAGGVIAMLGSAHAVFDGTPANPTEEAALAARALYLSEGCDGVVGLGGGSALDLAKAVRLLSGHEPPLAQYTAVSGGVGRIHGRICPMIASSRGLNVLCGAGGAGREIGPFFPTATSPSGMRATFASSFFTLMSGRGPKSGIVADGSGTFRLYRSSTRSRPLRLPCGGRSRSWWAHPTSWPRDRAAAR